MTDAGAEQALESALRALRHRDRSTHEVEARLAEQGFDPADRMHALETLERVGLVDDARFARARAAALAERGAGNQLIRHDLSLAGVGADLVEEAVELLDPEIQRARRVVEKRGASPKTARYLHGRGYAPDVVAAAVASDERGELP